MLRSIRRFLSAYKSPETPPEEKVVLLISKELISKEQQVARHEYYKTFSHEKFDKLFALYRDYLKHEDGLINYRATWLVSVQSFLIATFGFSYQKKFEVVAQAIKNFEISKLEGSIYLYDLFLLLLVIVGIYTSYAAILSVRAAVEAIGELQRKWEEEIIPYFPTLHHLPKIIGGGIHNIPAIGAELAVKLPLFFLYFWTMVSVCGVVGVYYDLMLLEILPNPLSYIKKFLCIIGV